MNPYPFWSLNHFTVPFAISTHLLTDRRTRSVHLQLHVRGLRSLGPLGDLELHRLALFQGLEAVATDRGVVDEHVLRPIFRGDKPIPLLVAKPLHGSLRHFRTHPFPIIKHDAYTYN